MLGTSGLILLAGRPAQGKSTLMFSLAREAAVDKNIPTAIFSLEMETQTCLNRMIGAILSIEPHDIKTGKVELNEEDIPESFNSAPLFIDDTPSLSVEQFRREATKFVEKKGVRMIFIDYLWLMTTNEDSKDFSNREEEIQVILQSLKAITAELDVSIVALAQLNKSLRVQGQYLPDKEDLKLVSPLSLTIPDVVCIIHRPRYYTYSEAKKNTEPEQTELILVKNPCGETGTIEMSFNPQYCRFENHFL